MAEETDERGPYTQEERELASKMLFAFGTMTRGPMRGLEGVTRGEMAMLGAIYSSKADSVGPKELSDLLMISTARVANTLNSLEAKGYVERSLDPSDRRRVEVRITDEGRRFFVARHDEAVAGLCQLVRDMGLDEAREFARITDHMLSLISKKVNIDFGPFSYPGPVE
jgi:DNA-binding MarR family transcriptional regulator